MLEGEFRAEYYDNVKLQGIPTFIRNEQAINYDWGYGSPSNALGVNSFSVRWTGKFLFEEGGYVFTCRSDDGCRVWVDDELVINAWQNQIVTSKKGQVRLDEGVHLVKVEYFENSGLATVRVRWEPLFVAPSAAVVVSSPTEALSQVPVALTPTSTSAPVVELLPTATPTDGEVTPMATPTHQEGIPGPIEGSSGAIVVAAPFTIEVVGKVICAVEDQFPGSKCHVGTLHIASKAAISQDYRIRPVKVSTHLKVEIESSSRSFKASTGKFTLAKKDARFGNDNIFFSVFVAISPDAPAETYGEVKVILDTCDSSGRCKELERIELLDAVVVKPGLELEIKTIFTCGIAVGEGCPLFLVDIVKKSDISLSQDGTLVVTFVDLDGVEISTPKGFELIQIVDEGDEKPLGAVTVRQGQKRIEVEIRLKVPRGTTIEAIKLGQPELNLK
ncbi:hypothetical protein IID24_03390 [Patescibacteria group bacterium]|nr:hypothetical protein [Patescibacteria group bacterium]